MKFIITLAILILSNYNYAQKFNRIYFEPTVNTKMHTASVDLPPSQTSNYFSISAKKNIIPLGLQIGLNFGYTLKNYDQIQFGISQDEILQGINVSAIAVTSFTPNLLLGSRYFSLFNGVSCSNVSFLYKYCIHSGQDKVRNFQSFLRIGCSYLYKPNNGLEMLSGSNAFDYLTSDSSHVYIEAISYNLPAAFRNSFRMNLGIDFVLRKGEKEFLTFSISYITNKSGISSRRGGSYLSYMDVQTTVTSKTNEKTFYSYYIKGSGNGLYVTLSKKIYPFKIINNKRKLRAKGPSN